VHQSTVTTVLSAAERAEWPHWRSGAGVWVAFRRTAPASGGSEDEHSLDVPGHGHEAPLAARLCQSAHRELTEAEHRFDDAEHRLRGLLAQSVEIAAFRRLQP